MERVEDKTSEFWQQWALQIIWLKVLMQNKVATGSNWAGNTRYLKTEKEAHNILQAN
jgi:hypothetical protein